VAKKKEKLPLSKTHPKLAKEAHEWDPSSVTSGSGKRLLWKCPNHHIYSCMVARRTKGSSCPICIGRKILIGFNDLNTTHPKLARELVDGDPEKISKGTKKYYNWKCINKHIFKAVVSNRTAGYGCPYCSGNKVLKGFNDLATTNPELAKELYEVDPTIISKGSQQKVKWECPIGHLYYNTVNARSNGKQNCPFCSGKQVLTGFNDIATTHPEIANQLVEGDPTKFSKGSKKKLKWQCKIGHVYSVEVTNRTRKDSRGCPYCSGKKVLKGFNDIATTHPDISTELIDSDPTKFSKGSNKKLRWKCNFGHTYTAAPLNRIFGRGCPYCSGARVLAGFNDLETTHPKIAKELFNIDPKTISRGSEKKLQWRCKLGHIYINSAKNRTLQGQNCSFCSGKKILAGFNDLETTHPKIARELVDADPKAISMGSVKKMRWQCDLGHSYTAKPNSRTAGKGGGCPYCSGNKVLEGFNDLSTTYPIIASELVNGDPKRISKGSVTKYKWKCSAGHIWITSPNGRLNHVKPSGCPTCSETGFDPNADGYLYFIGNNDWEMLQIGITNFPDDRLKKHGILGWKLLEIRGPIDGHLAQQWETAILQMLKAKGADLSNKEIAGKFDGYSEAWSKSTFPVKSIKELMRLTEEFEGN